MRKWLMVLGLVVSVASWALGQADVKVKVVKSSGTEKSGIDLSGLRVDGGEQGALFLKTLENDLRLSGWFVISPRGGSAVTLQGAYSESGGKAAVSGDLNNRATGQNLFRKTFEGDKAAVGKLAHQVADEIVRAVKNVPGIASTRILMVGMRGGRKSLFLSGADGADMVQLTKDDGICLAPNWAPDGRSLVYTSFVKGFPDVYRIDLTTNARKVLSQFPGINMGADISPDGREMVLALSKDGNPEIYIMGLGGVGGLERVTRTLHAAEASPSWSPDGKRIVYVSDQAGAPNLFVTDRAGRSAKRITFWGTENVAPDWGPNGWIAYSSRRGGRYVVCVLDPDTQVERAVSGDDQDYEDPSWAPDGRHIVCSGKASHHADIYILDTKGDNPVRLTRIQGEWTSPVWSPK